MGKAPSKLFTRNVHSTTRLKSPWASELISKSGKKKKTLKS